MATYSAKWTNKDNLVTYNKIPPNKLQQYSELTGLSNHCDLKLITDYIKQAASILEVGAGSGRVLDYLYNINYTGKIHAVECCTNYHPWLQEKFGDHVTLHKEDLFSLTLPEPVELVLWMWSGIADFSPKEHVKALKKLLSLLTDDGILIFDTLDYMTKPSLVKFDNEQEYIVDTHYGIISTYSATNQELEEYIESIGAKLIKHLCYVTPVGKRRYLHIVQNTT